MAKQYPRALDFLNQAVALQSWVPALIEKAKILIALSDWDQAMEMVQRILQQNERCMEALRLNVLMEMTQRADEQVALAQLQLLSKSLDRYEGANAKLFFETARSLSRVSGGRAKILRLLSHFCEKAIKLDPSKAEYVAELAHEKSMLGDYAGAMEMYRDAGRSDETNLAALYGTIYCQVMTGELEDAEQQLEFITAISDSIDQSPQLPYLKALIAWRRSGNAVENINLLVQAERIHFRGLTDRGGTNVFEMFFKLDPDFLIQLAKEYLQHMRFEDNSSARSPVGSSAPTDAVSRGIEILERVSGQVPGLIEAHLLVAHARFAIGQFKAATRTLNLALGLDSQSAAAHLLMARLALAESNHRGATNALEQAIACDFQVRKAPSYALVKAKLFAYEGDHDDALKILQEALRLPGVRDCIPAGAPGFVALAERAAVFVDLAATLATLSQFHEAMNILAEAQERFRGTSEEIRVLMSNSLLAIKRNDFDGAIQMLNEVPQSSSAYVHAQQAKANFYLDVRHDKRAYTQCFRDLVGLDPSARSYERLGAAYMHIQAPEAAIEAYEQAQNLDPRDASLAAKIGRALISTHDYLKATDYYITALRSHVNDINLRHDLAKLFMKLKKYGSAVQVLTYALEPIGVSTELPKMIQDVQSLLLLADIYMSAEECGADEEAEDNMFGADHSIAQTLLRARDLQRTIVERTRSRMETPEVLNEQKKIMAETCRKLALFYLKEDKLEHKAIASYQEALKADNVNYGVLNTRVFEPI